MKNFIELYKKIDGNKILAQYRHAHVFLFSIFQVLLQGASKKSLELVRMSVRNKIVCKLRKKYKKKITKFKEEYNWNKSKEQSNKVWVCWLQGIENAPQIVKKCYESLKENLVGKEIIFISEKNYKEYIEFPNYIQDKIDKGIISKTHMSDLLRLELLIKYGGTWIDATVLCSGKDYPEYILNSELFLFQNLKPGLDGEPTRISNWFITSYKEHPILALTRNLLYDYWNKNSNVIDYFIFHDFFELAIEAYPDEWKKVIPVSNSTSHILLLRLFEDYDVNIWNGIKAQISFHKLTYKFNEKQLENSKSYYNVLFTNK